MTPAAWLGLYLAVAGSGYLRLVRARGPTCYRGRTFLRFNLAFVAAVALHAVASRPAEGPAHAALPQTAGVAGLVAGVLLLAALARNWWFVGGASPAAVADTVAASCRTVRLRCEARDGAWEVRAGAEVGRVSVRGPAAGLVILEVRLPRHRKLELFQGLLAKQFRPLLPRPRIRV